jgi:hypothetical protein
MTAHLHSESIAAANWHRREDIALSNGQGLDLRQVGGDGGHGSGAAHVVGVRDLAGGGAWRGPSTETRGRQ